MRASLTALLPGLLAALVCAVAPAAAPAAEVTEVQDALDGDDPFDFALDVKYLREQQRARITKEFHNQAGTSQGQIIDSTELRFVDVKHTLDLTARFGLYHDLELSFGLPIILSRTISWNPAAALASSADSVLATNDFGSGVCPGPTTAAPNDSPTFAPPDEGGYPTGWKRNTQGTDGFADDVCIPNTAAQAAGAHSLPFAPLFAREREVHFAGVGDPRLGIAWGILNDERDDTKPSWVIGLEYKLPVVDAMDLTAENSQGNPGSPGDGFNRFTFWTAMSKRVQRADPYTKFYYTLSVPHLGKAFKNCEHPDRLGTPENCSGQKQWDHEETGPKPLHVGGVLFGSEIVPWEDATKHQKVALDAGLIGEYHSEGRDYSQASFMLGKLTYIEQFARVGGQFGMYFRGAEYVAIRLNTGITVDTEHLVTNESIGKDNNGNNQVDLDNATGELNPNFDFRYDVPGRRLRASEVYNFFFSATGVVNF